METTIILGLYSGYIGIMERKMDKSLKAVTGYAMQDLGTCVALGRHGSFQGPNKASQPQDGKQKPMHPVTSSAKPNIVV